MDFRHVTPPSDCEYEDVQCPGGSASTNASQFPHQDWSPATVMTNATTPPERSPRRIRDTGSRLLPKPRDQDAFTELPSSLLPFHGQHVHQRTASLPANVYSMQFGPVLQQRQNPDRRSISPYGREQIMNAAPSPAPAPLDHPPHDMAAIRPPLSNSRSVSTSHISHVRSHSRNISSSSIDASMLTRYGYPTYRQSPTPQPIGMPMSRTPSAMSHLTPITLPGGQVQNYPNNRRTASPPANPSSLPVEAEIPTSATTNGAVEPSADMVTTSALEYLTAPNPAPSLIQRLTDTHKSQNSHFWFDIRNLRPWTDFNVSTIASVPGLLELLKINVSASFLPTPGKVNLVPETPAQLAELCANHHAVKVNAALKLAQGDRHIAMRTLRSAPGARQQPEFVANYQSDVERTILGDARGRVVGIMKSYDQWNSGYRHGSPVDKIRYLEHLAHLHRFMRDHGTRYGFIMTEIELVCVRMGGPPSADASNAPFFGYLETATPIQISAHGQEENGSLRMTAGLALWYLHMLAKEQPFPGQFHWKVDVGGPAALTRRRHLPRDEWMPKVNQQDKRGSKRVRGWVWPDEPLHKRECGRGKKVKE